MQHKIQRYDAGSFIINIDSYRDGVLTGGFYHPLQCETGQFQSLMQLLLKIEQMMDDSDGPQSFHMMRTFMHPYLRDMDSAEVCFPRAGKLATFSLHIMFRRNASWQGSVTWMEEGETQNFRSALELITLMNSAIVAKQMSPPVFAEPEPIAGMG